jgi:hypothetical protein
LDATLFLEDSAGDVVGTAFREPVLAANVLDMAPGPASRTQLLSNMTRNPSNRRELE